MILHVLGPGFTGYRHLISIKHPIVDHKFNHARRPADILDVLHDVLATGFEVR